MGKHSSEHLSRIQTMWPMVQQAHGSPGDSATSAQRQLLELYMPSIRRYVLAAVKDDHTADELVQDFAVRFLRGEFKAADPARGRFRDYVKTAVYRLIVDHQRRQRRQMLPLTAEAIVADPRETAQLDREFLIGWRQQLIARAWEALGRREQETGRPLYSVLKARNENRELTSEQLAKPLGQSLNKQVTADWVRKWLCLAREAFGDLLLDEVARTLQDPSFDLLEEEAADLGLLESLRPALQRKRDHVLG